MTKPRSQIKRPLPYLTISTTSSPLTISQTPGDIKYDTLRGHE
jgi:hypothetical protein